MRPLLLLVLAVINFFWIGCTPQAPVAPTDPHTLSASTDTTITDISYGTNTAQKLDLGLPANRTSATPLIIVIHGGAWSSGDKGDLGFMTAGMKTRGFAVANINYRLSPQSNDNYNMQLDDINLAIQFALSRASQYTFNDKKVYIVGHSAGAHLALSYAYTRNTDGKVRAVGSLAAPVNLFYLAYYNPFPGDYGTLLPPFLNTSFVPTTPAVEARYKAASPFFQATATSAPTILFHGDADLRINSEQSGFLANQLQTLGVDHKFILYSPFIGHDWWANYPLRDNTMDELKTWFNNHP